MPLLKLPPEILSLICEQFCYHCSDSGDYWLPETLYRLCLTSKFLREVATPILYHRLPFLKKPAACLRTLYHRPDLAERVRAIHFDDEGYQEALTGLWDEQAVNDVITHLGLEQLHDDDDAAKMMMCNYYPVPFLALLPQLEDVRFQMDCELDMLEQIAVTSAGPLLPKLRFLMIDYNDPLQSKYFFGRTQLLRAAPNITSLWIGSCTVVKVGMPVLRHVTELCLWSGAIDAEGLNRLVSNCPSLTDFTYDAGDPPYSDSEVVAQAQVVAALRPLKHQLRRIDLGFEFRCFYVRDLSSRDPSYGFAEFTALEELSVDHLALFSCLLNYSDRAAHPTNDYLLSYLPPQLQSLDLVTAPWHGIPQVFIDRLLQERCQRFPRLQLLRVAQEELYKSPQPQRHRVLPLRYRLSSVVRDLE